MNTHIQALAGFSKSMVKGRRYDLPLHRGSGGHLVVWIVGVMTYLCLLSFTLIFGLNHLQHYWERGLTGHMTVEIPHAYAKDEASIDRLTAALNRMPGITAEIMSNEDIDRLVSPWLGENAALADLPLPKLIEVTRLDVENAADTAAIRRQLKAALPEAVLDTHEEWLADLLKLARAGRMVLVGVALILALTTALTVAATARTRLALHKEEVDLLHLIGATDAYIAQQFQRQAFRLAAEGAAAGLALAFFTLMGLAWLKQDMGDTLLPQLNLSWVEWTTLTLSPIFAGLIAMGASRFTVIEALKELP
jgi:cell division transport system permease protein